MRFCERCGTRLKIKQVKKGDNFTVLAICERCGYESKPETISHEGSNTEKVIRVLEEEELNEIRTMPVVNVTCSKCGYNQAAWWLLQTRSSDEPPTQFYRCLRCNHTWRQYA